MELSGGTLIPFIPRPDEYERLVAYLLDQRFFLPVAITTSLPGARGLGKTVLARALCADPRIRESFGEGIHWVTLGMGLTPLDLTSRIQGLIFDLTGQRPVLEDLQAAERVLHEILHPRRMLLVIDEADDPAALRPFLQAGPGGACMLIAHDDANLPMGARRVHVDIMMPEESVTLLAYGVPLTPGEPLPPGVAPLNGASVDAPAPENSAPAEAAVEAPASKEAAASEELADFSDATEFVDAAASVDAVEGAEAPQNGSAAGELPESGAAAAPPDLISRLPVNERTTIVDSQALAEIERAAFIATHLPDLPEETRKLLESLADRLGEWPLLLSLVNGMMRGCYESGDPQCADLSGTLHAAHAALDRQRLYTGWRINDTMGRKRAIDSVVAACLERFSAEERARFIDLAVFPAGEMIPVYAVAVLWSANLEETFAACERLARSALIDLDMERWTIRLHSAVHGSLNDQLWAGQLTSLHNHLVDAYRARCGESGWASGPDDGYYFTHLAQHLVAAGRRDDLHDLLFDFSWLFNFMHSSTCPGGRRGDLYSLLSDFELALSTALDNQSAQLRLVQDALHMAAPALSEDSRQLAPQLLGRLLPFKEPQVQRLLDSAQHWQFGPWLRPLAACFTPPGSEEVRVFSGHSDWITGVALLPDGQHALSSSLDGTLRMWNLANGQVIRVIEVVPAGELTFPLNQPEKETEAAPQRTTGVLSRTRVTGALGVTGTLGGPPQEVNPAGISAMAVAPDGVRAVTAGWDGTVRIWNLSTGQEERAIQAHIEAVGALVISPDGKRIISGSDDRLIRVWDMETGQMIHELVGHGDLVRSLAVTPDGRTLLSGSWDNSLRLWDLETGQVLHILTGHESWVQAVAVAPDGFTAVSSSWDRTLRQWDLWTGETVRELTGFSAPVFCLEFSSDGELLIAGSGDGHLGLWDYQKGESLRVLGGRSGGLNALAVSKGGRFALTGSDDGTLRVWDLHAVKGGGLRPGHAGPVHAIASAAGAGENGEGLIVSASWDGSLKVWQPAEGREVRVLTGHEGGVVAMALSADGRYALTGSRDHTLKLWDLHDGIEIASLAGHENAITAVALTPDAKTAVSGDDAGVLRVWDLANGALLAEFRGEASIWACALTADGSTITASESGGKMYFLRIQK